MGIISPTFLRSAQKALENSLAVVPGALSCEDDFAGGHFKKVSYGKKIRTFVRRSFRAKPGQNIRFELSGSSMIPARRSRLRAHILATAGRTSASPARYVY